MRVGYSRISQTRQNRRGPSRVFLGDNSSSMNTVENLVDTQAKQMRQGFEEASIRFKNTLDIAKRRELIVSVFLQEYLPPGYRTGNGEIIDQDGNKSGQVDVVVRNPFHPVSARAGEEPELFFAEGVFCAIE